MNSSFGTTVARHRRPHFRHCLASGPLADQLCTSRFGEREISTTIYRGLLKQPDNQKLATLRQWPFFLPGALPSDPDHFSQSSRIGGPTRQSDPPGEAVSLPWESVHDLRRAPKPQRG